MRLMDGTLQSNARAKTISGRIVAVIATVVALLFSALPTAANAAQVNVITGVVVNPENPGAPISLSNGIEIQATWAAPAGSRAGDSFRLGLPDVVTGTPAAFDLRDESDNLVGTCEVGARAVECTFTDYVESHENVVGTLHFSATASTATSEESWSWSTGSEHEIVTEVPGGIGPNIPVPPGQSSKYSWRSQTGGIAWELNLLGSDLLTPGGNAVTLVDTYDPRLSLDETEIYVNSATRDDYANDRWTPLTVGTEPGQYSMTFENNTFTLKIAAPDVDRFYRVLYVTDVPQGTEIGETFRNAVRADGVDFIEHTFVYQNAGGNGGGDKRNGMVRWNKVDENAAPLAGSEWLLAGPQGQIAVVDNGENDTDADAGAMSVSGLAWGDYTLIETKAPIGHLKSAATYEFTIGPGSLQIVIGDIENVRERGEVGWAKVDETGAPLSGSAWTLTPAKGLPITIVDNGENDADPTPGRLSVSGLSWGTYVLAETAAPAGYVLSDATTELTISAESLFVDLGEFANVPEETPPPVTPGLDEDGQPEPPAKKGDPDPKLTEQPLAASGASWPGVVAMLGGAAVHAGAVLITRRQLAQ